MTKVPNNKQIYPLVNLDLLSWTALSFAAVKGHVHVCQVNNNLSCDHAGYKAKEITKLFLKQAQSAFLAFVFLNCLSSICFLVKFGRVGVLRSFSAEEIWR